MTLTNLIPNIFILPGTFHSDEKIPDRQIGGIKLGIKLGKRIQNIFPRISEDYRNGKSLSQLVKSYDIKNLFRVNESVALESVRRAIVGYEGHLRIVSEKPYLGLITSQEELRKIGREHNVESCRLLGKTYGSKSGKMTVESGTGVHGMTYEEKRKAGQKGARELGYTLWSDEELNETLELSSNPKYQRKSRINVLKIAEYINRKYHNGKPIRSQKSVTRKIINNKMR